MINRPNIARALLIFGFVYGLTSLTATFGHIGDPTYMVAAEFGGGQTHSWHHALREVFDDVATIPVILYVFFALGANLRQKRISY